MLLKFGKSLFISEKKKGIWALTDDSSNFKSYRLFIRHVSAANRWSSYVVELALPGLEVHLQKKNLNAAFASKNKPTKLGFWFYFLNKYLKSI
jgi:hypothetical protein